MMKKIIKNNISNSNNLNKILINNSIINRNLRIHTNIVKKWERKNKKNIKQRLIIKIFKIKILMMGNFLFF